MAANLVRNSFYNFLTQVVILVLTFVCLPIVVHGLSEAIFGLLTLVWSFVGYFALLDFGISRASTKFLAEALSRKDPREIKSIVWTSITMSSITGVFGAAVMILLAPVAVTHIFHIEPALQADAIHAFIIAAIGIPFMLVLGTIQGFQMANQRFDIVNRFQLIMSGGQWVGSIVLLKVGYGFSEVVLLTVGIRIVCSIASILLLSTLTSTIFSHIQFWNQGEFKKLISFGGWVTMSQVISPLFLYLDRAMIGMFSTLTAVAYYSVPQESMSRMLIIPMSLTTTLFPAMSEQAILAEGEGKSETMYFRSIKYFFLLMLPVALIFMVHARSLLNLWMGTEFAEQSTTVFQILSVGMFFNVIAQIPATALHAYGRPDLTAKFHVIELLIMIGMNIVLIPRLGIVGVAITWSVRLFIDTVLLFVATHRYIGKVSSVIRSYLNLKNVAGQFVFVTIIIIGLMLVQSIQVKIIGTGIFCLLFVAEVWFFGLDRNDKEFLRSVPSQLMR